MQKKSMNILALYYANISRKEEKLLALQAARWSQLQMQSLSELWLEVCCNVACVDRIGEKKESYGEKQRVSTKTSRGQRTYFAQPRMHTFAHILRRLDRKNSVRIDRPRQTLLIRILSLATFLWRFYASLKLLSATIFFSIFGFFYSLEKICYDVRFVKMFYDFKIY